MISRAKFIKVNQIPMRLIFAHFKISVPPSGHMVCPFPSHPGDSTPSMKYYAKTNSFHCFGCKASGGPLQFVQKMYEISYTEAVEHMVKTFDISVISLASRFNEARLRIKGVKPEKDVNEELAFIKELEVHSLMSKYNNLAIHEDLRLANDTILEGFETEILNLIYSFRGGSLDRHHFLDSVGENLNYINSTIEHLYEVEVA